MTMIKVSATSRTSAVAGAIAGMVREHHRAEVQAIGAGAAVNQAVKALVVATGYLRLDGIHVSCVPEFADVTIEDKVRTAIKLVIEVEHSPNISETSYRLSHKLLNFLVKITSEYHKFGLVNYAILCKFQSPLS